MEHHGSASSLPQICREGKVLDEKVRKKENISGHTDKVVKVVRSEV